MRAGAAAVVAVLVLCWTGAALAQHPGPDDSYKHPSPAPAPPPPPAETQQPAEASEEEAETKPAPQELKLAILDKDVLPEKPRSGWAALPIAVYAPETQLGLGAFGSVFFRLGNAGAETRPSSMSLVGLYTLREQLIVEAIPELYWDDEDWHLWSRFDYRKYPNRTWAVGNKAQGSSEEHYQESRPRWQFRIGSAVTGRLFVYGHLEAQHMGIENVEPGGLIDSGTLPGSGGGRTIGLGPGIAWDTRDHLLVPHDGFFHEAVLMTYQPAIGSHHKFNVLRVNLRRYVPITSRHTLVLQYVAQLQEGNVPFYMLSQLGGQNLLRGYFEGRFRDKSLMAIQAEYRLPLFWRFSAVGHGALGDVASRVQGIALDGPVWSLGGGLRVLLNRAEQLNLRADLGVGYDTFGFYLGVAEAF